MTAWLKEILVIASLNYEGFSLESCIGMCHTLEHKLT